LRASIACTRRFVEALSAGMPVLEALPATTYLDLLEHKKINLWDMTKKKSRSKILVNFAGT
jgi:hypothetical protein